MNSTGNGDRNASDLGLIVQGILIFLSAVVAVVGYIVQSKLKIKEEIRQQNLIYEQHKRKMKLERIRFKIDTFLGPASNESMTLVTNYFGSIAPQGFTSPVLFCGSEKCANYKWSKNTLDSLTNGGVTKYWKEQNLNVMDLFTNKMNLLPSYVGPEIEEKIRSNPESKIGQIYIETCKRMMKSAKIVSDLVRKYGMHLAEWTSLETFHKKFPHQQHMGARASFTFQWVNFVDEFEEIVNNKWANNDYSLLYPQHHLHPLGFHMYLHEMYIRLTEQEAELGVGNKQHIAGRTTADDDDDGKGVAVVHTHYKKNMKSQNPSSKKYVA